MNSLTFTLFASILDDLNDYNRITYYKALEIEYCSAPFVFKAHDEIEACEAFYNSSEFQAFVSKHTNCNVFVLPEGETIYHRVSDANRASTSIK